MSDIPAKIQSFERLGTPNRFVSDMPLIARIDGVNFKKFTEKFNKPFDERLTNAFIYVTQRLNEEFLATVAYTQSDEISLCWTRMSYQPHIFGGKYNKVVSILASATTKYFNNYMAMIGCRNTAHFDCRAFHVPTEVEASEYFQYRQSDMINNSLFQLTRSFYSHKEMQGKNQSAMIQMLKDKGQDHTKLPRAVTYGSLFVKVSKEYPFTEEILAKQPEDMHEKNRRLGSFYKTENMRYSVDFTNKSFLNLNLFHNQPLT